MNTTFKTDNITKETKEYMDKWYAEFDCTARTIPAMMHDAIASNDVSVLEYFNIHNDDTPLREYYRDQEFIYQGIKVEDLDCACGVAAEYGSLDVLKWLLENTEARLPPYAARMACAHNVEIVRFICDRVPLQEYY